MTFQRKKKIHHSNILTKRKTKVSQSNLKKRARSLPFMSLVISQDMLYILICCMQHNIWTQLTAKKKKLKRQVLHAILPLIVFIWLGRNWEVCLRGQCVHVNKEHNKNVWQQKRKMTYFELLSGALRQGRLLIAGAIKASMTPFS